METKIEVFAHYSDQSTMIDLHGDSPEKAKLIVNRYLSLSEEMNIIEYRFVTGRGNHQNSEGERGKLHREFLGWISEENHQKIASIEKGDGYYQVKMNPALKKGNAKVFREDYCKDQFAKSIEEIKNSAEKNDASAQFLLGYCYQHGIGLSKNEKEAAHFFEKSANQGNSAAEYALGCCFWTGQGRRQNDQEAIRLFKLAAAKKHPSANQQLGDIYYGGTGVKKDIPQAIEYYLQSSDLGLDISKRRLASIYLYGGEGVKIDESKGFSLYKEVADKGDPFAAYNVSICYLKGQGTVINNLLAFEYAKQSADKNDSDAQWLMSQFYRGIHAGIEADQKLCLKYLTLAANNQHKHALFELSIHPSITDKFMRIDYLIKSAKAGEIIAQSILQTYSNESLLQAGLSLAEQKNILEQFWKQSDEALLSLQADKYKLIVLDAYMANDNFTKNQKIKIMRLLKALAEQENLQAFVQLGGIYMQDKIVKPNLDLAEKYWLEGAALGSHDCLCNLGYLYEKKKEYEKSFYYHFEAAKKGNANSHNQLGLYYQNGLGVEIDIEKAIEHFSEAIKLDDPDKITKEHVGVFDPPAVFPYAACNLGLLFWKNQESAGCNNQEDNIAERKKMMAMAIYWLIRADNAGHEGAGKILQKLGIPNKPENYQHSNTAKPIDEQKISKSDNDLMFKPVIDLIKTAFGEKFNKSVAWGIHAALNDIYAKPNMDFTLEKDAKVYTEKLHAIGITKAFTKQAGNRWTIIVPNLEEVLSFCKAPQCQQKSTGLHKRI